jgi:hypothetical protein
MKKVSLCVLTVLTLVVGGCASESQDKETNSSSSGVSASSEPVTESEMESIEVVRKENGTYKVAFKEGQSVYVMSTNLKTEESTELVNSEFAKNFSSGELELSFNTQDNTFTASLSISDVEELSNTSTYTPDQKYIAFIPYDSDAENKLGVLVVSNDQNVITDVKNNLDSIDKYVNGDSEFYEQSLAVR